VYGFKPNQKLKGKWKPYFSRKKINYD